jgi:hypothetical protein
MRNLRIHGDNIVECDRALNMLAEAFGSPTIDWQDSPLHAPKFRIEAPVGQYLDVQLFPGYGRWAGDIVGALKRQGAPLAEAPDAVITELLDAHGSPSEELLVAIEFCGALPAGNNAWQRCGRSYSYAIAGVPYLYVSELGGYELDANRQRKAPRLPNPLVPFAYAAASDLSPTFALPVYTPSPSINEDFYANYEDVFVWQSALDLIRAAIMRLDYGISGKVLRDAGVRTAKRIAASRRGSSVLREAEWDELLAARGTARLEYLVNKGIPFRKTVTIPVTNTARALIQTLAESALGVGTADMPFGVIPAHARGDLATILRGLYGEDRLSEDLRAWIADASSPLVVALVAGFKPGGEDSRPDRGLLPLVRMALGEAVPVLSIVYGPGRAAMWRRYEEDPEGLARSNGLWQALYALSDAILIDSPTTDRPIGRLTNRVAMVKGINEKPRVVMPAADPTPTYSEHDVDTVLKMMAAGAIGSIFEGLCNPPGGDWSGISLYDSERQAEYRWTSLPRVTGADGKRPDHVLQFGGLPEPVILSVESKDRASDFEANIGRRLVRYIQDLRTIPPNIVKHNSGPRWASNDQGLDVEAKVLSAGAFIGSGPAWDIMAALVHHELDMAIAVSFPDADTTRVVIACLPEAKPVSNVLLRACERLGDRIEVEVYSL